jgi:tetratricopeptide (TPR) repeat protein
VNSHLNQDHQRKERFLRLLERLQIREDTEDAWFIGTSFDDVDRSSEHDARYWRLTVRDNPNDGLARWRFAEALWIENEQDQAIREWRKVLVLQPDAVPAALRMAQMSFRANDTEEAVRWLKRIAGRRQEDDCLKTAILCLCLAEGETRSARALAEQFLDQGPLSTDLAESLFHVFRLFDDAPRARRAAGIDAGMLPRSPEGLWLAARAALWARDGKVAVACLSALSKAAPGGQVVARTAIAQNLAGDAHGAAVTLASATQLFLTMPEQLADLASALSWPGLDRLRQVVISTLQRMAGADRNAAAALALANYRLGDWLTAAAVLDTQAALPGWPQLSVVQANLSAHLQAHTSLPVDAAEFVFADHDNDLIPGRQNLLHPAALAPALLVLGEDISSGHREMLLGAVDAAAPALAVIEANDVRSDSTIGIHAGLLSECYHGIRDYQFGSAGSVTSDDVQDAQRALGYLPPRLAAEVIRFRDHVRSTAPRSVHVAGPDIAVAAGLGALLAGATQVRFHMDHDWFVRGRRQQAFFDVGMKRLLADSRCRAVTDSPALSDVVLGMDPARPVVPLAPGIDVRAVRDSARGIHRLRGAEALGAIHEQDATSLISVLGLADRPDVILFKDAISGLDPVEFRFVIWAEPDALSVADRFDGMANVKVMRWPANAGAFLTHCDLGVVWGDPNVTTPILSHGAVGVPLLQIGAGNPDMPSLGTIPIDSLPETMKVVAGNRETLADVGEQTRRWAQTNYPLRRTARAISRLDNFPESGD